MEKENLFKLMDNIMKEIGSREKGNKIKKKLNGIFILQN
jgi:hypothetical protein